MQEISAWGMSIVGAVAFAAFAEMLMPSGDIKKYVSLVLGVILIFVMVKPLIRLKDIAARGAMVPNFEVQTAELNANQDDLIVESYRKQLEYTVEARLKQITSNEYNAQVEVSDVGEIGHITVSGVAASESAAVMTELVTNFAPIDRITIE